MSYTAQISQGNSANSDLSDPRKGKNGDGSPPSKRLRRDIALARYTELHEQCWNVPLNPAVKTLPISLKDFDPEVGNEDDILPGGHETFMTVLHHEFLVRAEYIRAFDKVKALYKEAPAENLPVVTGLPGIGATISAVCFRD